MTNQQRTVILAFTATFLVGIVAGAGLFSLVTRQNSKAASIEDQIAVASERSLMRLLLDGGASRADIVLFMRNLIGFNQELTANKPDLLKKITEQTAKLQADPDFVAAKAANDRVLLNTLAVTYYGPLWHDIYVETQPLMDSVPVGDKRHPESAIPSTTVAQTSDIAGDDFGMSQMIEGKQLPVWKEVGAPANNGLISKGAAAQAPANTALVWGKLLSADEDKVQDVSGIVWYPSYDAGNRRVTGPGFGVGNISTNAIVKPGLIIDIPLADNESLTVVGNNDGVLTLGVNGKL